MKKFIQGALFTSLIIPIIDGGIIPLLNQTIKHICTWIATKTIKLEQQLSENTENQSFSQAIGFQIQNDDEEDCEGEE